MDMAFDGGAREISGRRVAGAGAAIWRLDRERGSVEMIARAVIGLPEQAHAQVAEAYGCRVGFQMLADTRCRVRAARGAGDNLNGVRYCASDGRIRKPHILELLESPLGECAARGWTLIWAAVRRRDNEAADGAATEGVYIAARMAE